MYLCEKCLTEHNLNKKLIADSLKTMCELCHVFTKCYVINFKFVKDKIFKL